MKGNSVTLWGPLCYCQGFQGHLYTYGGYAGLQRVCRAPWTPLQDFSDFDHKGRSGLLSLFLNFMRLRSLKEVAMGLPLHTEASASSNKCTDASGSPGKSVIVLRALQHFPSLSSKGHGQIFSIWGVTKPLVENIWIIH